MKIMQWEYDTHIRKGRTRVIFFSDNNTDRYNRVLCGSYADNIDTLGDSLDELRANRDRYHIFGIYEVAADGLEWKRIGSGYSDRWLVKPWLGKD